MGQERVLGRSIIALAIVIGLAGCATSQSVGSAPIDQGIKHTYNTTYEHAVAATMKALSTLNINITGSSTESIGTIILVSKPISAFSWGEVGRVVVMKSDTTPITVVVNWQKRDQIQLTGTDANEFTSTLFSMIDKSL